MKRFSCTLVTISVLFCFLCFAESREIVLATMEYPPYTGENLPKKGYTGEIATIAFERSGHTVRIKILPWKRAFEMTKKGLYDGILSLIYQKKRKKWFLYPQPLPPIQFAFLRRQDGPDPIELSVEALGGLKIGAVRGYAYPQKFEILKDKLHIEYGTDDLEILSMLVAGRINLVYTDLAVAKYIIWNRFPRWENDIRPIRNLFFEPVDHFIGISKKVFDAENLVRDFNKGFLQIKEDGTLDAISKRHRIATPP